VRFDFEPQFRGPPGHGRQDSPREPGDGGGGGDRRALRRCSPVEMIGGYAMKDFIQRFAALAAIAGLLAGCNTMAGVGKDVEKLGAKIEQKAKK